MILDLNVSINIEWERQPSLNNSKSNGKSDKHLVKCFICKKEIDLTSMQRHVGEHIMKGSVSGIDICGFCGKRTCENILKKTRGNKEFFKVQSNCQYFVQWKKTPQFSQHNLLISIDNLFT